MSGFAGWRKWRSCCGLGCCVGILFLWIGFAWFESAPAQDAKQTTPLVDQQFESQRTKRVGFYWDDRSLGELLKTIGETCNVAIVLDRRIDPNTKLSLSGESRSLDETMELVAGQLEVASRCVGDGYFLGPKRSTEKLRTLITLRQTELQDVGDVRRLKALSRERRLNWKRLDAPREILLAVAELYDINVENPELIPHDLWRSGVIANADFVEAVSLLLIQFDLTFTWGEFCRSIRLVPVPERVLISQTITARGLSAVEIQRRVAAAFPRLRTEIKGGRLYAEATVETFEQIRNLLRGEQEGDAKPAPLDWERRTLTFKVVRKPLGAVLETLKGASIPIVYDSEELRRAGIDLKDEISLEVEQATVPETLRAVCDAVEKGLAFAVEDGSVQLFVEQSK